MTERPDLPRRCPAARHKVLLHAVILTWAAPALGVLANEAAYVGSGTCTGCHTEAAAAWQGSHHALAWTAAEPSSIRADFEGTSFSHGGMTARFSLGTDGTHRVHVEEADGSTAEYPVHSVAGVEPLQQFLLETEPGRLQSFDVVWDTEEERWFHLYPDASLAPGDALHWTGPYKTWNARCAECHATGFKKNFDFRTRSYASSQAEIGVGCEACHGPGSAHTAWASAASRTPPPDNFGFAVDFADTGAAIQQCATCHSRREAHLDGSPPPGAPFHESYTLALLRPGLYHADGQILDEVYVYGSFLQSKMYAKGVVCTDCHDAHSATLTASGNAVCTQCHSQAGNPRFPSLVTGDYDDMAHHFHAAESEAAQCKSCHMTERVYMGNDWRADHSFRIPRPDLSAQTGAPDACTACHQDREPAWAAEQIAARHPKSDNRGPHFGQVLARGRTDPVAAGASLSELALDAEKPGLVRATALWLLANANSFSLADEVAPLLADPDPLVRAAGAGAQRMARPQDRIQRVTALLDDPMRSVRIAAARALFDVPPSRLPGLGASRMAAAMREWQMSLANRLDFVEAHLQIAGIALTTRRFPSAERAFREAVTLDPQSIDAWVMLARIASATGAGLSASRQILTEALAANPGDPVLLALFSELEGRSSGHTLTPPKP